MTFEQVLMSFLEYRAYERMIGLGIGALSVLLGFFLFKSGIETPQSAIVKIGNYEFRFLKVAPGLFFSLFGVLLVGYINFAHPRLESVKTFRPESVDGKAAQAESERLLAGFSGKEYDELMRLAKAINTAEEAVKSLPGEVRNGVSLLGRESSYGQLSLAVKDLKVQLNAKIFSSFPPKVFSACSGKNEMPSGYTEDICERLDNLKEARIK
ncbi:hypothetical protein [Photobacterium sanguinicancri]|uniref:Uncharacterized protein n=1 Tax=Photobacterium sanguinicancri TaxID=875932 RepID=A0ABX4FRK9_9GAMM|nr:hypothetical protein [Photobacterium sanguinicancri]OZS41532.1 hypothetical protein ASV53_23210 [Photobacterium sanguinicancri]